MSRGSSELIECELFEVSSEVSGGVLFEFFGKTRPRNFGILGGVRGRRSKLKILKFFFVKRHVLVETWC